MISNINDQVLLAKQHDLNELILLEKEDEIQHLKEKFEVYQGKEENKAKSHWKLFSDVLKVE